MQKRLEVCTGVSQSNTDIKRRLNAGSACPLFCIFKTHLSVGMNDFQFMQTDLFAAFNTMDTEKLNLYYWTNLRVKGHNISQYILLN